MQTVLSREINGYKIVIGYGKLSIDPVETQKVIIPVLKKDKNVKRVEDLKRQLGILEDQMRAIRKKKLLVTPVERKQHDDYENQRQEILKEVANLLKLVKKRKDELTIEKAIYFQPTKNEVIKTNKEIETLKAVKLSKNELLDVNGKRIPNYTGVTWWMKRDKWEVTECNLGEVPPDGAKIYENLTEQEKKEIGEQNEKDRIDLLSLDEKKKEKQEAIYQAAIVATNKKVNFEIQNMTSTKALKQAQKWYEEQVGIIEKKYK